MDALLPNHNSTFADLHRKTGDMEYATYRPLRQGPGGGLPLYARFFHEVLGNRRRHRRSPVSGTIYVMCNGYSVATTYTCACIDVSRSGIGIEAPESIRVGSFVTLYSGDVGPRRLARVRYCLQGPEIFRIGLEFAGQPVSRSEADH